MLILVLGSLHELERNKLVSIFLRTLEYYEGILFLTTNRISNLDTAFQSRIHVSIAYPNLTTESRRQIWSSFLKIGDGTQRSEISEKDLDALSQVALNGRQIKNIARIAATLAAGEGSALRFAHIETALKALQAFDSKFAASVTEHQAESTGCTCGNGLKRRRID